MMRRFSPRTEDIPHLSLQEIILGGISKSGIVLGEAHCIHFFLT